MVRRAWSIAFSTAVVAALTAGGVGGAVAAPGAAPEARAAGPLAQFYNQRVVWTDCGTNLQCGTVTVPLDYRKPKGMTISLAVNRLVSAGPTAPSLVINPGGPGGSGVQLVAEAGNTLLAPSTPSVPGAFNIVGFDPRGVGASLPLVCITPAQHLAMTQSTPVTKAEIAQTARGAAAIGAGCMRVGKGLTSNMGTEMVARDLDIIRAALGEPKLDYLGMSYGSYLGSVYARLFADRVGKFVLDGIEYPLGTLPGLGKAQAQGFQAALVDWAKDCASRKICPQLGTDGKPESLVALVGKVSDQLAATPAPVTNGTPITQDDFLIMTEQLLTIGPSGQGWLALDVVLYALLNGAAADIAPVRDATAISPNEISANLAVQCYDRPTAGTAATSVAQAKAWSQFSPVFGASMGWDAQACFTWPVRQGQPSIDATPLTKAPVLLIGGTHDPNTPYWMAQKTTPLYKAGRLLTWTGYGHVASNRAIPCVNNAAAQYLINGVLPAEGTVCVVDSTSPPQS